MPEVWPTLKDGVSEHGFVVGRVRAEVHRVMPEGAVGDTDGVRAQDLRRLHATGRFYGAASSESHDARILPCLKRDEKDHT